MILDCTLRDGGYYTDWNFDSMFVDQYVDVINRLDVAIVEVGYRNHVVSCNGPFYYLPIELLAHLKASLRKSTKLAIMIDSKFITNGELKIEQSLDGLNGLVEVVRFTFDPWGEGDIRSVLAVAKAKGFEVHVNLMYAHRFLEDPSRLERILGDVVQAGGEWVSLVDSFGCMVPDDISSLFMSANSFGALLSFGFHGHNNLGLAAANAIVARKHGASLIDSTICGMGRGAGNLKTEDAILLLESDPLSDKDRGMAMGEIGTLMNELFDKHKWGPSLAYMIAALNRIPQGKVMDLVNMKRLNPSLIVDKIVSGNINFAKSESPNDIATLSSVKFSFRGLLALGGGAGFRLPLPVVTKALELTGISKVFLCSKSAVELYFEILVVAQRSFSFELGIVLSREELAWLVAKFDLERVSVKLVCLGSKIDSINGFAASSFECSRSCYNPLEFIEFEMVEGAHGHVILAGFDGNVAEDIKVETQSLLDNMAEETSVYAIPPTSYCVRILQPFLV